MKEDTLVVHEIYASVQGESTFAGLPCTFVRLTGCNLRCTWCDTPQAFYGGKRLRRAEVLAQALATGTQLVELTGAGRTDRGVHARMQVVAFRAPEPEPQGGSGPLERLVPGQPFS